MAPKAPPEQPYWKHKPFPELIRLAWPITVSTLSYSVMTVTDTLFVGRLGASALAGVALGGIMAFTLLCFGIGLLRSVKVLVSQAVGGGARSRVPEYIRAGLLLGLCLGLIAAFASQLAAPWIGSWSSGVASGRLAAEYLALRGWGGPMVLAAVALREGRYGQGDSRSPMRASLAANLANVPLNAALIFGLGMGVQGAAAATLAAQTLELAMLVHAADRRALRAAAHSSTALRELMSIGVPLGAEFFLDISAMSLLAALMARMGEVQLASHQIALQLSHFGFMPAMAVGESAGVLAGQAVGAGQSGLVRKVTRYALWLNLGYMVAIGVVLLCAGPLIASAFSSDPAVRRTTVVLLRVSALLNLCFAPYVVARCGLRGTGSVRFPAIVTVTLAWLVTPPVTYWLGVVHGWGALGGWLGLVGEVALGVIILWWRLGSGAWLADAEQNRQRVLRRRLAVAPGRISPG